MATKNTGLITCYECNEYIEECACEGHDYEGDYADACRGDEEGEE